MRRLWFFTSALAVAIVIAACSKSSEETTVLQADDLTTAPGASFDANEVVDLASFTDKVTLARDQVQGFLERTPYDHASFLSTYSSNGVRAVDAILRASDAYTINPLVFLVAVEAEEGLIGAELYPIDSPSRVEYVFNCGCAAGRTSCDPALAGFDVQIDCFGRALRASLAEITTQGRTSGGWAPATTMTTLDGVKVTPVDASTAALYQYTPAVDVGKAGGSWLFWNLWQKYASALSYFGGSGGGGTATAWIGDACTVDGNCGYTGGVCATNYPGGLCTTTCTTDCPSDPTRVASFCADFSGQGGYCLPVCNPAASACRTGYACQRVTKFNDATQAENVCVPQ
jgi:hypothetical protein